MVRKAGLEPACLSAPPPQDGVSANFTTSALGDPIEYTKPLLLIQALTAARKSGDRHRLKIPQSARTKSDFPRGESDLPPFTAAGSALPSSSSLRRSDFSPGRRRPSDVNHIIRPLLTGINILLARYKWHRPRRRLGGGGGTLGNVVLVSLSQFFPRLRGGNKSSFGAVY